MKVRAFFQVNNSGKPKLLLLMPVSRAREAIATALIQELCENWFHEDYSSLAQFYACVEEVTYELYNHEGHQDSLDELPSDFELENAELLSPLSVPNLKDAHAELTFYKFGDRIIGLPINHEITKK